MEERMAFCKRSSEQGVSLGGVNSDCSSIASD